MSNEIGKFTLRYNVYIKGKSGQRRQIDLLAFKPLPESASDVMYDCRHHEFEIFDCKERARPASIQDVEQFIGFILDTNAKKGTIISSLGFTAGAQRRAKIDDSISLRKITWKKAYDSISEEVYPNYIDKKCGKCDVHILWYGVWSRMMYLIHHLFWLGKCMQCEAMHLHCEPCGSTYRISDNRAICPSCRIYYGSFRKMCGTDEKPGRVKYKPKTKKKKKSDPIQLDAFLDK